MKFLRILRDGLVDILQKQMDTRISEFVIKFPPQNVCYIKNLVHFLVTETL